MVSMNDIKHVFEAAGLGVAPFRFTGLSEQRGPINLPDGSQCGAPGQPMGTCAYCGRGIAICCAITDANGKKFIVGNKCVEKTGDTGMISTVKRSKRRLDTEKKWKRVLDMAKRLQDDGLLKDALSSMPHSKGWANATKLDEATWIMRNAGLTGRLKLVREIEKSGL